MKICLVSSSFYPAHIYGGPIDATWHLSNKLADKNFKIYVSTTNANGKSRLDVKTNSFISYQPNFFVKYYHEQIVNYFSFSFIKGICNDIHNSDLVYIQYLFHYTVFFSLIFSLIKRKKILICPRGSFSDYTLNNSNKFFKSIWINFFVKFFSSSIKWHACSDLEKNDILKNIPNANVLVINDGIDFNSFQKFEQLSALKILNLYTNKELEKCSSLFFSLGRLHKIKCYDNLISSFKLYIEKDSDAKLVIAGGDDGHKHDLINLIKYLDLENSVFLIGHVNHNDRNILLNNCNYFVLPSEFESFGLVVAEAMSCGKPILVSNKTSWHHLEKNNCGILVDNSELGLYKGLINIQKAEFNKNIIKTYVKTNYDWSVIVDIFIKKINKL